jgi:hypothetical protein
MLASLPLPYEQLVERAHVVDVLAPEDRDRVLTRLVARYPEAVATVLDDMGAPDTGWQPALDLVEDLAEVTG